jgi:hypothetical protein
MGGANYKKLLPVIVLIAIERARAGVPQVEAGPPLALLPPPAEVDGHVGKAAELPASAGVALPSVVTQINRDIEEISRTTHLRKERRRLAPSAHVPSKAEKRDFGLRPENQQICEMVVRLDSSRHFLELSSSEQEYIRQCVEEERLFRAEQETAAKKERRKLRKQEARALKTTKKEASKRQNTINKLRQHYEDVLRNVDFEKEALERIIQFDTSQLHTIESRLGIMNEGKHTVRDAIIGTSPTVYEAKAGYDYRIYYSPNGSKTLILMIGDKGTQDRDVLWLRSRYNSAASRDLGTLRGIGHPRV